MLTNPTVHFARLAALNFCLTVASLHAIPVRVYLDTPEATAEQSSVWGNDEFPATNAFDGDPATFTHTGNDDPDPTWTGTLASPQQARGIILFNRHNCCQNRLSDVTVEVYSTADAETPAFADVVNIGNELNSPAEIKVDFGNTLAVQKIVVRIPGGSSESFLSLGEVRLYSSEGDVQIPHNTNLTHANITTLVPNQSTVGYGYGPGMAIDGSYQNFTHTETGDVEPYWEVDFGENMSFQRVKLFNRTDCCQTRLRDITVQVLNENYEEIWASELLNPANSLNSPAELDCYIQVLNNGNPVVGRIVRVSRAALGGGTDDDNVLSLAEVDIIGGSPGTPVPPSDSDGDGIPDEWETLHGLNPNDPSDAAGNADEDLLTNLQEYQLGTNPRNADTDGDGLLDHVETRTGVWVSATDTGTFPLIADTDGDGLLDGRENPDLEPNGIAQPGSNPHKADTDEDGWGDATEAAFGSNPKSAASIPTLPDGRALLAYWPLNDATQPEIAKEVVRGLDGTLLGAAAYTDDAGGYTGEPGDRAVDLGPTQAGSTIKAISGEFLSLTATTDQVTLSFWQKLYSVADSRPFAAFFLPDGGDRRGLSAHTTWSNNNFYWDTSGCCDESAQRVWIANPGYDLMEWHHFVFLKNGEVKQIWVDGELMLEGYNYNPLPDTFTTLFIGSSENGAENVRGVIDDFAIFGTALEEGDIVQLAQGASPLDLGSPPVPTTSFAITNITYQGGTLSLSWESTVGGTYLVQRSETLAGGSWNTVATVTATGASTSWTDNAAPLPASKSVYFYRVQKQN